MSYNEVKLTPSQDLKWMQTRSAVLLTCPAFTHILFSLLNPTGSTLVALFTDDKRIPTAATDGFQLIVNAEWFFNLSLAERVFVVAHEIMHCILNHCIISRQWNRVEGAMVKYPDGKEIEYHAMRMNAAMDYVINDILVSDHIGKMPEIGLHDRSIGTWKDDFLTVYRRLPEPIKLKVGGLGVPGQGNPGNSGSNPPPSGGQGNQPGQKNPYGGFDTLLKPGELQGKDPGQAEQERSQTEWDTAIAAAIASAKLQGKLPAHLERLLKEVLEPTVAWQEHIRSFFARKVGAGSYNWRKPDHKFMIRDIYYPARSGNGCGDVVVGIDTSGSIGQKELDIFFAELRGILDDVRPQRVFVVWCDAKVHKVDECEDSDDVGGLKPWGGGGTDFRPVFDWIYEEGIRPDALVYMTDGYGTFPPNPPDYPVVWGSIVKDVTYPWGEVVPIELKAKQ